MTKNRLYYLLSAFAVLIVAHLIHEMMQQPGVNDLPGGFEEKLSYRNENNTGPIQRIYIVTVKDTSSAAFESYGDLMPHSKYGLTRVYFFLTGSELPSTLVPGERNFEEKYDRSYFAVYEKSAMGQRGFIKNKRHAAR